MTKLGNSAYKPSAIATGIHHLNVFLRPAGGAAFIPTSPVEAGAARPSRPPPAVIKAGLPPALTFHDLRKAAGSIAASPTYAGASPKTVQNLLGHSVQQVTTESYIAEFAEDTARVRASLERIYSEAGPAVHLQCDPDSTVKSMAPRRRRKAG
ncbi:MAG TPA: hypothetical protein VG318_04280 [Actinomycetota bacterium]|nr:hypothetical protein [Actinomycetota bacterium]